MPPAYIYRLDTSRRMISQHGPFVSYQVNVDADGQKYRWRRRERMRDLS